LNGAVQCAACFVHSQAGSIWSRSLEIKLLIRLVCSIYRLNVRAYICDLNVLVNTVWSDQEIKCAIPAFEAGLCRKSENVVLIKTSIFVVSLTLSCMLQLHVIEQLKRINVDLSRMI
jgi:hypothetical protein